MATEKVEARDAPPQQAAEQQEQAPDTAEIDALLAGDDLQPEDLSDEAEAERLSRNQETYDSDDVHEEYPDDFEPPELLDAPDPRPGFVQRWVSTHIAGVPDVRNMARKANVGWRPRSKDTVKAGIHAPTIAHGQFEGRIGVEGMVLMERPIKLHQAYARKNRRKIRELEEAVKNNLLNVHQPGVGLGQPTMETSSRVTQGNRPEPAPD